MPPEPGRRAAGEPDFEALYRQLGMPAGGSLVELRQRYRRLVAQWHPDRDSGGARAEERLKLLNLRFSAALEFHRRYGRLPAVRAVPAGMARRVERRPAGTSRPARRRVPWLVVVLAAGVAWLAWPERDAPAPPLHAAQAPPQAGPVPDRYLQLGLDHRAALQLLGQPILRDESAELWSYGPSWVQFECGRVAGWYSSPLLGLHAEGVRPGERVGLGPGDRRRACAPEPPTPGGF